MVLDCATSLINLVEALLNWFLLSYQLALLPENNL